MKKGEEARGHGDLPVAFVDAELSGLTRISCCQDERRALDTTRQGPVSVLDASQ